MLNRLVASSTASLSTARGSRAFSRMPFRVHRGAITAPSDPIHANQRVECTWTVRRDSHPRSSPRSRGAARDNTSGIEKLKVLTPGLTIIRVRPELWDTIGDDAVARVRVTSSSADVLRNVQIASQWPNRTLVDFRAPHTDRPLWGHLVTEIDLPHANAVRSLAAIGLGDVVVEKDVLYAGGRAGDDDDGWRNVEYRGRGGRRHGARRGGRDAHSLKLLAANESRLFIHSSETEMELDSLKVGAMGTTSHVEMDLAGLDLHRSLELGVVGGRNSGVSISTDSLIASRLKLLSVGNGELQLAARRHLEADDLRSFAVGAGSILVDAPDAQATMKRPTIRTRHQSTTTIGMVCVDSSSLPTERARVTTIGSNDLCLQTRHALRVRSVGSSVVECVDRVPSHLNVRGLPSPTLVETPLKAARETEDGGTETRPSIKPLTEQEAFEHESLLLSPRSSFLSRLFGRRDGGHWYGTNKYDSEESDGTAPRGSSPRRPRRRERWAADRWV